MSNLTLIYSYYKNKGMFIKQQQNWAEYTPKMKKAIEIIVTDDCTPSEQSIDRAIIQPIYPNMRIFKIKEKVPWNWLQCRNIGARYSESDWILLTDMDHMIDFNTAKGLLKRIKNSDPNIVYQLNRLRAVDGKKYKHHNDSFVLTKKLFWKCGGYDEHYSGLYGTSGMFRRRLYEFAKGNEMYNLSLILYGREVISDASTTDFPRKEGRDPNAIKRRHKCKPVREVHLALPYEEVPLDQSKT